MDAPESVEYQACGVSWRVSVSDLPHLRPWLDVLHDLDSAQGVEPIKRSRYRTVRRLRRQGVPGYILKEYRVTSRWQSLKERWVRSAAATEWNALLRLRALGVSVSRAVAFGRPLDRCGDARAYSVLEEVPDVLSLKLYYLSLGADRDSQSTFAADLGSFVRRFHDAGVRHNDLHAGNVLVRTRVPVGEEAFVLIDLQRVRTGRVPRPAQRAAELAMVLQTFRGDTDERRALRSAVLEGYVAGPPRLESLPLTLDRVDRRIAALRDRRAVSRSRRCLVNSTQYAAVRRPEARVHHRRDYTCDELLEMAQLGSPPPSAPQARSCAGHDAVALDVHTYPASLRLLGPSRAVEGYVAAHQRHLDDKSLPRPIAAIDVLRGPRKGTSLLIVERFSCPGSGS